MKEDGAPSTPKPAIPYPQTTPRQKEPAVLAGTGILRTSPWVVLKNLLPQGGQEALSDTQNPPSEGGSQVPQHAEGGPGEAPTAGKSAGVQEQFNQKNPPGTFLAREQQAKEAEKKGQEALEQLAKARRTKWMGPLGPGKVSQAPPCHGGKHAPSAGSAQRPCYY